LGPGTVDCDYWPVTDDVILKDCAGSTSCDIAHSHAAEADMVVVVLPEGVRAEEMHADALVWAWRLKNIVRVIFVTPKIDLILASPQDLRYSDTVG
jgi:hypothetical protein